MMKTMHTANQQTAPFAKEESTGIVTWQMQLSAEQPNHYPQKVSLGTDQMAASMEQEHAGLYSVQDWSCENPRQSKDEVLHLSNSRQHQAVNFYNSDHIRGERSRKSTGFEERFNTQIPFDYPQRNSALVKHHTVREYEQDFPKETQLMNPETQTSGVLHAFKETERTDSSHSILVEPKHVNAETLDELKKNGGFGSHGMEFPLQMLKKNCTKTGIECNKNTSAEKTRKRPRRFYTGGGPFVCSGCSKTFRWRSHFIAHERIHTGEKPFSCGECDKSFRWSSQWIDHLRSHTGERTHNCTECGESFHHGYALQKHQKIHSQGSKTHCPSADQNSDQSDCTADLQTLTREKPYACTDCGKRFKLRDSMVIHLRRVHTGERPYVCTKCEKSFLRRHQLRDHHKMHRGERTFPCIQCGQYFRGRSQLIGHLRSHTGEVPKTNAANHFLKKDMRDFDERPRVFCKVEPQELVENIHTAGSAIAIKDANTVQPWNSAIKEECQDLTHIKANMAPQFSEECTNCRTCRINSPEPTQAPKGNDQQECNERDPQRQPKAPEGNDQEERRERDPQRQPKAPEGNDQEKCSERDPQRQQKAPEGNDQEECGEHDPQRQPKAPEGNDQEERGERDPQRQPKAPEGNDQEEHSEHDPQRQPKAPEENDQEERGEHDPQRQPKAPEGNDQEERGERDPQGQPKAAEGNDQEELSEHESLGKPENLVGNDQAEHGEPDSLGKSQTSEGNDHEECDGCDLLHQLQGPEANSQEKHNERESLGERQVSEENDKELCGKPGSLEEPQACAMNNQEERTQRHSLGQPQVLEKNEKEKCGQSECVAQEDQLSSTSQISIHCGKYSMKKISINPQRLHAGNGPFVCSGCGKRFQWRSHFIAHERIHTGEKPFTCNECGRNFRWSSQWVEHQRSHTGEKPYMCTECGKCYNRSCDLSIHRRIHTGERPYKCECGKSFIAKKRLIMHLSVHVGEKKQACKVCGEMFHHSYALLNHQKVHEKGNTLPVSRCEDSSGDALVEQLETLPYICSECGQTFKLHASLIIHQQRNHSEDRLFSCTRCEKSFTRMHNLRTHFKMHHKGQTLHQTRDGENANDRLPRICQYPRLRRKQLPPSATSNEIDGLVRKKQQHTAALPDDVLSEKGEEKNTANYPGRLKPLNPSLNFRNVSTDINKTCRGPQYIERQMEVDSSPRCQKDFCNQSTLQQQMQAIGDPHKSTGNLINTLKKAHLGGNDQNGDGPPYICSGCGKIFQWRSHFIAHERIHTGEKPFSCSECGKSFRWSSQWNDHRKYHTGNKLYTCMECGKTFSGSSELATHKKSHVAEHLYTCDDCGKGFTLKQRLTMHQRCHIRKKR